MLKYKCKFKASVGKLIQGIRSFVFEKGDLLRFLKDKMPTVAELTQTNQLTLSLKAGQ